MDRKKRSQSPTRTAKRYTQLYDIQLNNFTHHNKTGKKKHSLKFRALGQLDIDFEKLLEKVKNEYNCYYAPNPPLIQRTKGKADCTISVTKDIDRSLVLSYLSMDNDGLPQIIPELRAVFFQEFETNLREINFDDLFTENWWNEAFYLLTKNVQYTNMTELINLEKSKLGLNDVSFLDDGKELTLLMRFKALTALICVLFSEQGRLGYHLLLLWKTMINPSLSDEEKDSEIKKTSDYIVINCLNSLPTHTTLVYFTFRKSINLEFQVLKSLPVSFLEIWFQAILCDLESNIALIIKLPTETKIPNVEENPKQTESAGKAKRRKLKKGQNFDKDDGDVDINASVNTSISHSNTDDISTESTIMTQLKKTKVVSSDPNTPVNEKYTNIVSLKANKDPENEQKRKMQECVQKKIDEECEEDKLPLDFLKYSDTSIIWNFLRTPYKEVKNTNFWDVVVCLSWNFVDEKQRSKMMQHMYGKMTLYTNFSRKDVRESIIADFDNSLMGDEKRGDKKGLFRYLGYLFFKSNEFRIIFQIWRSFVVYNNLIDVQRDIGYLLVNLTSLKQSYVKNIIKTLTVLKKEIKNPCREGHFKAVKNIMISGIQSVIVQ